MTKYLFFIMITVSCSSTKTIKTGYENRELKSGDIMQMNSEEFLVQNNTWCLRSTEHFKFFFDTSIEKDFQSSVIESQEFNYKEITSLMGISDIELKKINFWLFKDKEQKKELTLVGSDAHAISTFPSVYYLPYNATGAQEVGHVLTQFYWGFIPKTSNYALIIDEGFNYYIDNERFYEKSIIENVKEIASKTSIDIVKMITENEGKRIRGVQSGSHEYDESMIAGSFVEFLIRTYGIDQFEKLWKKAIKTDHANPLIFKEVYNKNITLLNNEFLRTLK